MSKKVNIYDGKPPLSQLVERAEVEGEIIITSAQRKPGRLRGRIRIAGDFDAPLSGHLFDRALSS